MGLRIPPELDRVTLAEALRRSSGHHLARRPGRLARLGAAEPGAWPRRRASRSSRPMSARSCRTGLASGKLPTQLAIGLDGRPLGRPLGREDRPEVLQRRRSSSLPLEVPGADRREAPLGGPRRATGLGHPQKLAVQAGPLIDLRKPGPCPTGSGSGRATSTRSSAWPSTSSARPWHALPREGPRLAPGHRPGSTDILGMSEEDQIRLTARLLQVARQADPAAQFLVGLDRPWAEWMASSTFQLGPLHLADYLARAELGMAGIGLEIAPGYSAVGQPCARPPGRVPPARPVRAASTCPLHVGHRPAQRTAGPDPIGRPRGRRRWKPDQWSRASRRGDLQREPGRPAWFALVTVAKPFVRSVAWRQLDDAAPPPLPPRRPLPPRQVSQAPPGMAQGVPGGSAGLISVAHAEDLP